MKSWIRNLGRFVASAIGVGVVQLHARTLRLQVEGEDAVRAHVDAGGGLVFASWHGRFYAGIDYFARYAPAIMISASGDGTMIARVVARLGWTAVRGSSSRGGSRALIGMVNELRKGRVGGHIVDGPRGPVAVIKPGLVVLAQRASVPIVPVYVAYRNAWRVRSWDRFCIPKPFSRVLIRFGDFVPVPKDLTPEQISAACDELGEQMKQGYARADADVQALA